MGVLSKVIGIVFAGIGFIILFYGMGDTTLLSYVWSFLGLLVMSMGFALLTSGRPKEEKPPPPTVTEIKCNACDFKEIRDFQKGDYILKPVEQTCPKCQSAMTIDGVYVIREEPEDKIEV